MKVKEFKPKRSQILTPKKFLYHLKRKDGLFTSPYMDKPRLKNSLGWYGIVMEKTGEIYYTSMLNRDKKSLLAIHNFIVNGK